LQLQSFPETSNVTDSLDLAAGFPLGRSQFIENPGPRHFVERAES